MAKSKKTPAQKLAEGDITANEFLLDKTIRHAVFLQRVKTQTSNEIVALLNNQVIPDLLGLIQKRLDNIATRGFDTGPATTRRLSQLLTSVEDITNKRFEIVREELDNKLEEIATAESEWVAETLGESTQFAVDFAAPNPATLKAITESRPFNGKVLSEWWDGIEAGTQDKVQQQVNIGLVQGESTDQIVRRLKGTAANNYSDGVLQTTRREVEAVVRTAANHVSTHAREATFEENSDIIDKVMIVATLDTRTTPLCRSLDGKTYPVGEGPRPPFHFNCRTTVVPVMKPASELGLGLNDIPESTRASMDGQVPESQTYGDWLQSQTESTQNEALGPARAQLYRDGKVTIDQFVDDKGKPLTLKQLRALDSKP